jgi:hypothetical protein
VPLCLLNVHVLIISASSLNVLLAVLQLPWHSIIYIQPCILFFVKQNASSSQNDAPTTNDSYCCKLSFDCSHPQWKRGSGKSAVRGLPGHGYENKLVGIRLTQHLIQAFHNLLPENITGDENSWGCKRRRCCKGGLMNCSCLMS